MASMQINVLFHGLFVMEYTENAGNGVLEAYAPQMSNAHTLMGGVRSNLVDLTGKGPIDWTSDPNLQGNPKGGQSDLNGTQIIRFSRTNTGVGDIKNKDRKRVISLPWPQQIFALRIDDIGKFNSDPGSNVGKEIKANCPTKVGFVTATSYSYTFSGPPLPGWTPSRTFHFYHSPNNPEHTTDVNKDLLDLQTIFTNGQKFDLSMVNTDLPTTPIDPTIPAPPSVLGIGPEDELSFGETFSIELQHTVSKLLLETVNTFSKPHRDSFRSRINPAVEMLNPANCPNLFLLNP